MTHSSAEISIDDETQNKYSSNDTLFCCICTNV
nr:MAG TPA: hypothetical protein [Caudoviricetes sp.]